MVDSTAYEPGTDAPSLSLVGGERARSAGPEHASALLRMGALKQDAGDYSEAEELFRRALEIGERALGPENPALVPAMTSLASARIMCGRFEDAEPLVLRALAVSEVAEHDPDLAIVLNDLARLCLKQSAHSLAEPLLLRMLSLKRSKGEDHPEVATVLASLATVRQALGRHESAEQLWKRVLEIRERTLAPNHFALATALEHLAEACAARGKIGEALQLLQRAQTIRELTLGTGHSSVRIARDRIADLQLQAEGSLDAATIEAPAPSAERYRLLSADHRVASAPPTVKEKSGVAPRKGTARVIDREPPTTARVVDREPPTTARVIDREPPTTARVVDRVPTTTAWVVDRDPPTKEEIAPAGPPPVAELPAAAAQPAESAPVNFRDVIMSIRQELADDDEPEVLSRRTTNFLTSIVAALKERQKMTAIIVASIALLLALATATRAWSGSEEPATASETSPVVGTQATPEPTPAGASSGPVVLANDTEKAPATAAAAATPVASTSRARVVEQRTPAPATAKKPTDLRAAGTGISIPKVSPGLAANFDSVVQARSGSARGAGDPLGVPPALETGGQRVTFERDAPVNAPQRAQLIGSLPTPRYPSKLVDARGEVRVRFDIDASGRPVMSSLSVVNSPNTLLTAAVLKVIPDLRFEPARTGGADSRAVGDVVQLAFQFRPNE